MGLDRLQRGGNRFRMAYGAGNFTKQFNKEVKHGELQNLKDNKKTILKVIDKYKNYIRRNILGRKLQRKAYLEIKNEEGNKLTIGDKRDIKKVLKHFIEKPAAKEEPKEVSPANRAEAEDPNNLAPDSVVKKVGERFTINREINNQEHQSGQPNQNDQNGQPKQSNQIAPRSLNIQREGNLIRSRALGMIEKEKAATPPFSVQRNEELIKPAASISQAPIQANVVRSEEFLSPAPAINQAPSQAPSQAPKIESIINRAAVSVENIEKQEVPANTHALGLAKREKNPHPLSEMIKERQINDAQVKTVEVESKINVAPISIEKAEVEKEISQIKPQMQRSEELVRPQPIAVEKKEIPITSQPEIAIKPTPTKVEKVEKVEKKEVESKINTTPINIEKAEVSKVEKEEVKVENKIKPVLHIVRAKPDSQAKAPVEKEPVNLHALGIAKREKNPHPLSEIKNRINPAPVSIEKPELENKVESGLSDSQKKRNIQIGRNIRRREEDQVSAHGSGIAGVKGPKEEDVTPFAGESAASRGQAARAKLNYEHALNLGGSKAAQEIQKDSFRKMNDNNKLAA